MPQEPQQPLIAPDHPSLRAFFLTHHLFPLAPSPAAKAADKGPGGQAVRAMIAVGDVGWMRRQRNYLLLLRFALGPAVTVDEEEEEDEDEEEVMMSEEEEDSEDEDEDED